MPKVKVPQQLDPEQLNQSGATGQMVMVPGVEPAGRSTVNGDIRISPAARKHFGPSPFAPDGPFWKVYAGDKAFTGVTKDDVESGDYPFAFVGWNVGALSPQTRPNRVRFGLPFRLCGRPPSGVFLLPKPRDRRRFILPARTRRPTLGKNLA